MKENEVKRLIPKYVIGQLGEPSVSIVEQGLQDDPRLWDEVRFWRAFAWVKNLQQHSERDPHPSPECLADFKNGVYPQRADLLGPLEGHLEGCPDCRQLIAEIRCLYDDATELRQNPPAELSDQDSDEESSASIENGRPPSNSPINLPWAIIVLTSLLIGFLLLFTKLSCSQH